MDGKEQDAEQLLQTLRDELATVKEQNDDLQVALGSARRVGTAIGILMATHKLTPEQSFEMLSHSSQLNNLKVRDLAENVIRTGTLPTRGP